MRTEYIVRRIATLFVPGYSDIWRNVVFNQTSTSFPTSFLLWTLSMAKVPSVSLRRRPFTSLNKRAHTRDHLTRCQPFYKHLQASNIRSSPSSVFYVPLKSNLPSFAFIQHNVGFLFHMFGPTQNCLKNEMKQIVLAPQLFVLYGSLKCPTLILCLPIPVVQSGW